MITLSSKASYSSYQFWLGFGLLASIYIKKCIERVPKYSEINQFPETGRYFTSP